MSSTKTQQPYFPHYANKRNEDSIVRLRMAHGVAGYGVYHMLLERLRLSENYRCELDYDILCWDLDCCEELIKSVIYDFGLFEIMEDGQMFQSSELNEYMVMMEEKKRKKSEDGKAAAEARWEKIRGSVDTGSPKVEKEPDKPVSEVLPPDSTTERLDKEIEAIKCDETWLKEMSVECKKTTDELISYLEDFRKMCILRGLKNGHKDMSDTLTHFRSWIYKSGRAKDPKSVNNRNNENGVRGKRSSVESYSMGSLEKQMAERHQRWDKAEKSKVRPDDYIKNKGYDPAMVTILQLMQPHWCENNPPTHPEWIGKYTASTVEAV